MCVATKKKGGDASKPITDKLTQPKPNVANPGQRSPHCKITHTEASLATHITCGGYQRADPIERGWQNYCTVRRG